MRVPLFTIFSNDGTNPKGPSGHLILTNPYDANLISKYEIEKCHIKHLLVRVGLLGRLQISPNFIFCYPVLNIIKLAYSRFQETVTNSFMIYLKAMTMGLKSAAESQILGDRRENNSCKICV